MEYSNLEVWTEARILVRNVYDLTKTFPKVEMFGLTNQIRRCAVSVPSNIAEGSGRRSSKDTLQFLYISRGSLYELETQIYLSLDQNYISEIQFEEVSKQILRCKKLINGFIKYYKNLPQ